MNKKASSHQNLHRRGTENFRSFVQLPIDPSEVALILSAYSPGLKLLNFHPLPLASYSLLEIHLTMASALM